MSIVRLAGVVREVGDFVILDHVDASISAGDRIGLVGPNGAGKTTLLRLVAGLDEPDGGEVHRKRGLTVALLPQEAHVDSDFIEAASLRLAVRAGAVRLEELEASLRRLEHEGRVTEPEYENLQHEFAVKDGYALDQRVEAALSGLGFERREWDRPPTFLSGGEQTRAVWPGCCSPIRSCCCLTSRRTTSTSAPWSGWRTTSGGATAAWSSLRTTEPFWMPP